MACFCSDERDAALASAITGSSDDYSFLDGCECDNLTITGLDRCVECGRPA